MCCRLILCWSGVSDGDGPGHGWSCGYPGDLNSFSFMSSVPLCSVPSVGVGVSVGGVVRGVSGYVWRCGMDGCVSGYVVSRVQWRWGHVVVPE